MFAEGNSSTYGAPRSASELLLEAFGLYRRFPLLFFVLAAAVVVPYRVIVLIATGSGPFSDTGLDLGTELFLILIEWVLVTPLISALHVHAVADAKTGRIPRLGHVTRKGLQVLPVVAAASIIAALGIGLGLVLFIVPGVILMFRWYVVAQAAAIESEGWLPALRRSRQLTAGHYGHMFVFAILVGLVVSVPAFVVGSAFGDQATTAASFLVALVVEVLTSSFGALATACLYFDLRARQEPSIASPMTEGDSSPPDHSRAPAQRIRL